MAFESLPRDAVNSLQDPGIYYVNEHGRLRAPPGYSTWHSTSSVSKDQPERCYPAEATRVGANALHRPPSLLHICVDFAAEYIHCVESLVGFPELIGESLFRRVAKKGMLDVQSEDTKHIFLKFCEAYGELVCKSFVFRNASICLENCADILASCFGPLAVLDLGGCKLGDDHELIQFISKLKSLKRLGLCDNALSDQAIQKLTTPLRMFSRGPKHLEALNLADNPKITDKVVRYLKHFKQLRDLDLSRTSLTAEGVIHLTRATSLVRLQLLDLASRPCVLGNPTMEGWATAVLENWIRQADPVLNQPGLAAQLKNKNCFYGSQRKKLEVVQLFQTRQIERHNEALEALSQQPLVFKALCSSSDLTEPNCEIRCEDELSCMAKENVKSQGFKKKSPGNTHGKSVSRRLSRTEALCVVTQPLDGSTDIPKRKRLCSGEENADVSETNKKRKYAADRHMAASNCGVDCVDDGLPATEAPHNLGGYSAEEQDLMRAYVSSEINTGASAKSLLDALSSHEKS